MPPQAPPQQQDNSMAAMWIIIAIFIFVGIIWYLFRVEIIGFIMQVRIWEINLVSLFSDTLEPTRQVILNTSPVNTDFNTLASISNAVGGVIRYPFIVILILFAAIMYLSKATLRYKSVFTMQRLLDLEKVNWPQITPVVKLNLIQQDIEKGKWSMAMTPMQFCKRHRLLAEEEEGGVFDPRVKVTATLLIERAYNVFSMQLGRPWKGASALRPHAQALFIIFAARAHGDGELAKKLTDQIAASTLTGKLNFEGLHELLLKYENSKLTQRVTQNHAYELTVMASMLRLARNDGVLPTADFLWLKPLDRRLWYMLNSVGRATCVVEIAGPFAHWIAERELGRRISVPMVDESVKALDEALSGVIYEPEKE